MNRENHPYPEFLNVFLVIACLGITFGFANRAFGQVPCSFDITHVIQGPNGGWPSPPVTVATSISPNGEYVVGFYYRFGGDERGFVYRTATGQFTTMPLLAGISSLEARDVNDAGLVVGHMGGVGGSFAFVFDIHSDQYLAQIPPAVNAGSSNFYSINVNGVACGTRTIREDGANPTIDNAFIWSAKDGVLDLGIMSGPTSSASDINDNGTVVGHVGVGQRLFLWHEGRVTYFDTPPDTETYALAINSQNEFVGRIGYFVPTFSLYGFFWDAAGMTNLGTLRGDTRSNASGVNDSGVIVGRSRSSVAEHAFIWFDGVMYEIADFVQVPEGITLFDANDINNSNTVVAAGRTQVGLFLVGVVLEPVLPAPADIDMNCRVDIGDLLAVIADWGKPKSLADINGDGVVNILDLLMVIAECTSGKVGTVSTL